MRLAALLALGGWALAQQPDRLEFEVASVKAAAPLPGGRGGILIGIQGGPGSPDPERIHYNGMPLKMLITMAYDVKPYQITAPAWMDSPEARFDIVAKVPPGTTKDQARVMLQNLLADRFKLALHHETRELPLYELTVAKNGPKLEASVEDPSAPPPQGPPPIGKDGLPQLPAGRKGAFMMRRPAGMRMMANVQSMPDLANMLSNNLGNPVVDKTGLSGTYNFVLEYALEPGQSLAPGLLPPPPPPPARGGPGDVGGFSPVTPDSQSVQSDLPNLFTAVQEQLGLKLTKTKGSVDTLIIDRAERTPTEN